MRFSNVSNLVYQHDPTLDNKLNYKATNVTNQKRSTFLMGSCIYKRCHMTFYHVISTEFRVTLLSGYLWFTPIIYVITNLILAMFRRDAHRLHSVSPPKSFAGKGNSHGLGSQKPWLGFCPPHQQLRLKLYPWNLWMFRLLCRDLLTRMQKSSATDPKKAWAPLEERRQWVPKTSDILNAHQTAEALNAVVIDSGMELSISLWVKHNEAGWRSILPATFRRFILSLTYD